MLPYYVIAPILIAVFLYVFSSAKAARIIAIAAQAVLTGFAAYLFYLCKDSEIITYVGDYESVLGITLRADTLASVFIALTALAFLLAALYSFNDGNSKLFWFLLFIWQGLLIGIFLTRDLFNVFVLIEVATVVVAVLIMYHRDNRSMYDGTFYLMVSIVAMQFYLFGVGYIYKLTGVLDLEAAAVMLATLEPGALVLPYALIITAIALKCAVVPLFSWLPKAHGTPSAPSAISAILSGVYIKSGVYLFIRTQVLFEGLDTSLLFLIIGFITGIAGFILAMSQKDIKLLLAYSTVSQVGLIVASLSIDSVYAQTGGLYHVINHALFKLSLFMVAGVIVKYYGSRNIDEVDDLLNRMPIVGIAGILAVLGITGAPMFNGSISKYFIMDGTNWLITALFMVMNLGTIIVFLKFSSMLFRRNLTKPSGRAAGDAIRSAGSHPCNGTPDSSESECKKRIPVSINKQIAVLVPSALCFLGGLFGEEFIYFLFRIDVNVDAAGYAQKTLIYIASVSVGFLFYKYGLMKNNFLRDNFLNRIREINIGFRATCVVIGGFFAVILIFAGFVM